ncbi:MAG: FIST N-terminal domain-containing protein [Pseudomonadota bacterium]
MEPVFFTAISQSEAIDSMIAAGQVIDGCKKQLGSKIPQAAILFAGIDVDHSIVLKAVSDQWKGIHVVGCTTDGELSSLNGYSQDSVLLILLGSDTVEFGSGIFDLSWEDKNQYYAVLKATMASVSKEPTIGLMFSDGLTYDSEKVIAVFRDILGNVPIFGGIAADNWRFTGTKQFHNDRVMTKAAPYLMLCGKFDYAFGVGTGWKSVGEPGVVTRADKNTVYEIDYRPAMTFYRELLGEKVIPSNEIPIAVYNSDDEYRFLRTSFQEYDAQTGSISYLGNIPEGYRVRLTIVDRDSIISGAAVSMKNALADFPKTTRPALALCFSCSARRAILGSRTKEETTTVQSILGDAVPIAGFYTYGEISPPARNERTQFHNESFTSLLLG